MQATLGVVTNAAKIELRYTVRVPEEDWVLPEGSVPESVPHSNTAQDLVSILEFWASRADRPLFVARNLAIRWLQDRPSIGVDPDVCVLDPPPPEVHDLESLCLWKPGHQAPGVCFEVVSRNHPYKDYSAVHERYAAFGARELVVVDPRLYGPRAHGGPFALQVWRRDEIGVFQREYAGPGPVFSQVLGAWVIVEGGGVHVADDRNGRQRWSTAEDWERAEKERERAEKERERAEKERERAEKEQERRARVEVEERLAALERRIAGRNS